MTRFLLPLCFALLPLSSPSSAETHTVVKMSADDIAGDIFERPDMEKIIHPDGHTTLDVTSLKSSDGTFASGMYKSGKTRMEVIEPWGVEEFMYFLEGSVTMTGSDGTVTVINAGEAVTVPSEWTGIWETPGYTKIWVIYSADGSAL